MNKQYTKAGIILIIQVQMLSNISDTNQFKRKTYQSMLKSASLKPYFIQNLDLIYILYEIFYMLQDSDFISVVNKLSHDMSNPRPFASNPHILLAISRLLIAIFQYCQDNLVQNTINNTYQALLFFSLGVQVLGIGIAPRRL